MLLDLVYVNVGIHEQQPVQLLNGQLSAAWLHFDISEPERAAGIVLAYDPGSENRPIR